MQKFIYKAVVISGLLLSISCYQEQPEVPTVNTLADTGTDASSPYLTQDQNGNAVLCWTERSPADSLYRLKYARYDAENKRFGKAITVAPSAGTRPSEESMNKVAFKADGSILAVFSRKFENQENRFAGALLYSASTDQGKTWSASRYLHSDTAHTYGRNYFDLARMKNGEIGAVWLDGRFGKADQGSALFFASTSKSNEFQNEICVDRSTCQCCRTDLLVSADGKLHIAYRSIMFPPKLLGQQVRDMAYTSSEDHGRSFSQVKTISSDHWAIEGCPHTGPSLANTRNEVYALWFTAGGNAAGVYFNKLGGSKNNFSQRQLLSPAARHPQLARLQSDGLAMVWEESGKPDPAGAKSSHHGMTGSQKDQTSSTKIRVRIFNPGKEEKSLDLTDGTQSVHHAVLTPLKGGVLVAWVNDSKTAGALHYSYIEVNN